MAGPMSDKMKKKEKASLTARVKDAIKSGEKKPKKEKK